MCDCAYVAVDGAHMDGVSMTDDIHETLHLETKMTINIHH